MINERIGRAAELLSSAHAGIALTGAGVSAESGIPTFRGEGGLWSQYDPVKVASIGNFLNDPTAYWSVARERGPAVLSARPNPGHAALAALEEAGHLVAVITQNTDGLHQDAGTQRVIELHAASPHQVYMLGFAPGFPYLGGLDSRLGTPRRSTPRTKVPAGSVAIAREQSAIYSIETPGGWNILGRTPLRLFTPETDPPCLLQPGDNVRFVPVSVEQFNAMREKSG